MNDPWDELPASTNIEDRRGDPPVDWGEIENRLRWPRAESPIDMATYRVLSGAGDLQQPPYEMPSGSYDNDIDMAALRADIRTVQNNEPDQRKWLATMENLSRRQSSGDATGQPQRFGDFDTPQSVLRTVPVDHDPFDGIPPQWQMVPVEHDPFPVVHPPKRSSWSDVLGETWPVRMAKAIYGGMTLPADVYAGRTPVTDESGRTSPQVIERATDLAGLVMGGTYAAAPVMKDAAGMGIRAYHGSPHDFERFDISKIGTGEGAQAYGHGLYFAENPATAQSYKETLGGRGNVFVGGKQLPSRPTGNIDLAAKQRIDDAARTGGTGDVMESAIANAQSYADYMTGRGKYAEAHANDVVSRLKEWQTIGTKTPQPGRMYEVNINAKPEQLLDWDKPLAGQPEGVRETLFPGGSSGINRNTPTGTFYDNMASARGKTATSDILRDAGIPGIKYLDQGSRNAGGWHITPPDQTTSGQWMVKSNDYNSKGLHFDTEDAARAALNAKIAGQTRNYVMFDDKLIDILRKYGLAGLSMLPPATAAAVRERLVPVDHDPFAQ